MGPPLPSSRRCARCALPRPAQGGTLDIQTALDHYIRVGGTPPSKISLGLGIYGRSWTLADPARSGIGAAAYAPGSAGACTGGSRGRPEGRLVGGWLAAAGNRTRRRAPSVWPEACVPWAPSCCCQRSRIC